MPKGLKGFQRGHISYDYWLGKKLSKKHKQKLSEAKIGKKLSKETKIKMSKNNARYWLGKNLSLATRKKLSKSHKDKSLTIKHRKKIGNSLRGKNSSFWRGGLTKKNNLIRRRIKYCLWRKSIFARDKYICQKCGQKGKYLEVHHIKSFAHFPKLRFYINNGITLCRKCHCKTDNFGKKGNTK